MVDPAAGARPIPRIERSAHGFQFIVDERPTLLLGGQLHNSTPTDVTLPDVLGRVRALHASVVIGSASWSLVEPTEGRFDFSSVDRELEAARRAGLRLVLIWFGAFKNATSTYAPTWVRADPARFPRAVVRGGRKEAFTHGHATSKPVLSVFSESLRAADQRAFVSLMDHLRTADPQHTVLMVQVENEVGLLRDSRDRSETADAAWSGPVPDAIARLVLEQHPDLLRAGATHRSGTWAELLAESWEADELFMAWHFGTYLDRLAVAGKASKPLPMFANAWLGPQPGQPEAGDYPSGGPTARVLDVWKLAAPNLDFLSPDVYIDDGKAAISAYRRADNALFVPESRVATGNLFWALGLGAFGFSMFGVDDIRADSRLGLAYGLLDGMADVVIAAQAEGRIAGILLEEDERQDLEFGSLRVVVQGARALLQRMLLDAGVQAPPAHASAPSETGRGIPAPADTRAFGLLIEQGPDEFIVVGQNLAVDFAVEAGAVEIDAVEAGYFSDGTWTCTRVVNGDERLAIVPLDEVGVARVRLLRLST
ncbi:DUF5597 domain-containing protein [Amnibacterium sp.]|uniref:DUF5597 domain-containing protein n=1 Tax=Amnibacterium sp. TaxID=1872496 RepID=UPI003F7CAFA2